MRIRIADIKTPDQIARSFELLQRTNQLNLSANKYTEHEFMALLDKETGKSIVIYGKDKYGDYGQVAFIHYTVDKKVVITEYAMSCRIAAKLVENALFAWLQRKYGKQVVVIGKRTERNGTLVDALKRVGFSSIEEADKIDMVLGVDYVIRNSDCVSVVDEVGR